jgi:hypothetical protein
MRSAPDFTPTGSEIGELGAIMVMVGIAFGDIAARGRFGVRDWGQVIYPAARR